MKQIFLEPDEEIISVIDKIKAVSDRQVAIVVPKNSGLFQSLINLKLLAREAKANDREVVIVTTNKVGQRLAAQVGLKAYNSLGAAPAQLAAAEPEPTAAPAVREAEETVDGVKVHRYQPVGGEITDEKPGPNKEEAIVTVSNEPELPAVAEPKEDLPMVEEPKAEDIVVAEPPEEAIAVAAGATSMAEAPRPRSQDDLPPIVSRGFAGESRSEFHMPWHSLIIAAVLLLIVGALVYLLLPRAIVAATFPSTPLKQDLTLTAQTSGDGTDLTIAGTKIVTQANVSKTFSATGQKDIGSAAAGSLTFYNGDSSSPVALSAGTKLSSGGVNFTLDKATTIPGASVQSGKLVAGQAAASVTAASPGTSGNISNGKFAIAGEPSDIYASGTTAGGSTKTVTVLQQSDIDAAITDLKNQAATQATADLQSKLNGLTLLDKASWTANPKQTVSNVAGDQVDTATATYVVEYDAIAFDAGTAKNRIITNLSSTLTANQELVIQSDSDISYATKSVSVDGKTLLVTASVQGHIIAKVDKATIAAALKNKSVTSAEQIVKDTYGATDATVSLSPSWWPKRLPLLSGEITVNYNFSE